MDLFYTDIFRFLIVIPIFFYFAYTDWKYRKILSLLCYVVILFGGILFIIDFYIYDRMNWYSLILGGTIVLVIFLILYYTKAGRGDYKALFALYCIFPLYPNLYFIPLFSPNILIQDMGLRPFILITIENTSFISIFYVFHNFIQNMLNSTEKISKKYFISIHKDISKINEKTFGWVINKNSRIYIEDLKKLSDKTEVDLETILKYCTNQKEKVWIETGIPLVTLMFMGLVVSLVFGISPIDLFYNRLLLI